MPGRQYDDAFALLERSFNDSTFLKAYRSLPVKKEDVYKPLRPQLHHSLTSTTDTTSTTIRYNNDDDDDDDDDDATSEGSMHEGYGDKATRPIALNRNNSGLPPTPPTQSREASSEIAAANSVPLPTQTSGLSTPVYQQSPPTPDLTPPKDRNKSVNSLKPPRPRMAQFPSSQTSTAASFVTAREDASMSSAETSQLSLPTFESVAGWNWSDTTRQMRLGDVDLEEEDDGDATPTRRKSDATFREQESNSITRQKSLVELSDTDNTNFLRNVTIRKKRPKQDLNKRDVLSNGLPLGEDQALQSKQNQARVGGSTTSQISAHLDDNDASIVSEGDEVEWPMAVNDMLYKAIRDEKSKRLSGISQTSTVRTVEAIVIEGPRRKKQTLRHAGKNLALRDDLSRSSLASETHSLRHKRAQLSSRTDIVRGQTKDEVRAVSNPEGQRQDRVQHPLHHSKPNASLFRTDFVNGESIPLDYQRDAYASRELDISTTEPSPTGVPFRLRHVSAPLPSKRSPQESKQYAVHEVSPILDWQGWNEHIDNDLDPVSPISEHPPSSPSLAPSDPPIDHTAEGTFNLIPNRADHNASTHALFEYTTVSPFPAGDSVYTDLQNLYPSRPLGSISQLSERSGSVDINEARAVTLHTHRNKSLAVIDNLSPTSRAILVANRPVSAIDETSSPTDSDATPTQVAPLRPIFTAVVNEPSTPPRQTSGTMKTKDSEHYSIDSPFKDPRPAPLPPVIIIPPTPVPVPSERVVSPSPEAAASSTPGLAVLERRQSLVQKARRCSESIIQPFLPIRSNSIGGRRATSLDHSSSHRPTSEHDRDHTLHPFWRPRGFWDDFSSDDSVLEDYDALDADADAHIRLPAGGDTSDVASLERKRGGLGSIKWPRKMSVRMPGFMGSGGFLVGNSLGIDRHGTNNRRHYIQTTRKTGWGKNEGTKWHKRGFTLPFFVNNIHSNSSPALRKKRSGNLISSTTQSSDSLRHRALRQRPSQRNLRRRGAASYTIPVFNLQMQVLSVREIKEKLAEKRQEREEKRKEVRRRELKGLIGTPRAVQ
ncbi:hypothetical protein BDV97DRAFT_168763 [Delphinella strobiligena]|nr:hypothetical protein BDV97DRAFT_168763 [Delphinella strobiligena]